MKREIPPSAIWRTMRSFCSKSRARVFPERASGGTANTPSSDCCIFFSFGVPLSGTLQIPFASRWLRELTSRTLQLDHETLTANEGDLNHLLRKASPIASVLLVACAATIVAQSAKPKRINQAIELLAEGQPIYYTGSHSGTTGTYEQGMKDAQTYADYISYDMEHAPFDVKGLQEYMRGLVAGGPDRSGHRTPAVIVNVPVNGMDAAGVPAKAWMFN